MRRKITKLVRAPDFLSGYLVFELRIEHKFSTQAIINRVMAKFTMDDIKLFCLNFLKTLEADIVGTFGHFHWASVLIKSLQALITLGLLIRVHF